tara:strand:+ start:276 stop:860 length:585 start_codon:yes stop_codon:yes gene_type:complete
MFKKVTLIILVAATITSSKVIGAESGGMPQLDPEFWISQIFWLVLTFGLLYIILSKFILPGISKNLENRKSQIVENIETADNQRLESEKLNKEYERVILDSKLKAKSIINNAKKKLINDINKKQELLQNEIDKEIKSAEKEIKMLIDESPAKINKIAIDTSSDLLKQLIGAEVNKSNISAIVEDLSRKRNGQVS